MLGTVLTRLLNKVTSLIFSAMTLIQSTLSKIIGALTNLKTQFVHLRLLLVLTQSNISRFRANFITAVSLIKAGITPVLQSLSALGQRLLTTVRQTLQLVMSLLKKGK